MKEVEVITTGHWIFAAIFAVAFVIFLIWSYRKDAARHAKYEMSSYGIIMLFAVLLLIIYIFKRLI